MNDLYNFTMDFLSQNGAIAEEKNGALEVVFPAGLAKALGVEEYCNLIFSSNENSGTLVFYDSEIFKKMPAVLQKKGRYSVASALLSQIRVEKLKKKVVDKINLANAVFSVGESEERRISYLLAFFKFTAFSDERREGVAPLMINEFNLSSRKLEISKLDDLMDVLQDQAGDNKHEVDDKILKALCLAPKELAMKEIGDFLQSANRRLNRDSQRIHEYYYALISEAKQFFKKRVAQDKKEKEKTLSKIKAIETELKWKINDLIAKYSIEIRLEPVSFIRVETAAPIFWLTIKRRKSTRLFPLTYNPLLKTFDDLPCESCFFSGETCYVCDDRSHIVCGKCFSACAKCGKSYCRACYGPVCSKCGFIEKGNF